MKIEGNDESNQKIKLTAMQLFRKILFHNQTESKSVQLEAFLPFLLQSLEQLKSDSETVLKVEALHTLTEIAIQKHQIKKPFIDQVCKVVHGLLDDRKRCVRKFARNCINEW